MSEERKPIIRDTAKLCVTLVSCLVTFRLTAPDQAEAQLLQLFSVCSLCLQAQQGTQPTAKHCI